jgi:hypothetical protein
MECVCGCGREVPKRQTERNFTAATVALELLAWDKNRLSPVSGPEGREGLIARGADCYQRLLYAIHEEGSGDPDEDCAMWLTESATMRLERPEMNKRKFMGSKAGSPDLSEGEMERLDRRHPELTFSGHAAPAEQPRPAAPGDDLVGKLERLRTLRDDGVLTEDEFAAAKGRLLG